MSSIAQTSIALLIVALAAAWLVARALAKRGKPGCGGDCGCAAADLRARVRDKAQAHTPVGR